MSTCARGTSPAERDQMGAVLEALLEEARGRDYQEQGERRIGVRYPYFRPATVTLDDDRRPVRALTRDISRDGLGLVHQQPLMTGEGLLALEDGSQGQLRMRVRIIWSQPCGNGWHLSGGAFLGLA